MNFDAPHLVLNICEKWAFKDLTHLEQIPNAFLYEGSDASITNQIAVDTKSTWIMSVLNPFIFLIVGFFDISRFLQISVQFFETFRFVDNRHRLRSLVSRYGSRHISQSKWHQIWQLRNLRHVVKQAKITLYLT